MNHTLGLHLVQWRILPGDVGGNLDKAGALIEGAGPGKGDLILLPEMFPSGFSYGALEQMAARSGSVTEWMADTALKWNIGIAGSMPYQRKDGVANTMVLMNPDGRISASYDKIHLFPVTGEHEHFISGSEVVTASFGACRVGLLVCFDLRFPEVTRRLCAKGCQLVLVSAQWPAARADHFRDLVRVRAMENQMFVAACNSWGKDAAGLSMGGSSMVTGPYGDVPGVAGDGEEVLSVRIDLDEVERVRREFPVLRSRRDDLWD